MTWLRIDDKFPRHPKIATLNDKDFRTWVRLLCYCAEYKTHGKIPDSALAEVPNLTNTTVTRYVTNGLLERDKKGALTVHDWKVYNPSDPTAADRMRRLRSEQDRNSDRNRSGASRARDPVPSPYSGDEGRDVSGDAAPTPANGAAPLNNVQLGNLAVFVGRNWDEYPNKVDLHSELMDRGATSAEANQIIQAEETKRGTRVTA